MKQLWEKIMAYLKRYTDGCYGMDELSNVLYVIALILIFVSLLPHCRTYIRIPKGHGKVIITCPKCRTQFERKT